MEMSYRCLNVRGYVLWARGESKVINQVRPSVKKDEELNLVRFSPAGEMFNELTNSLTLPSPLVPLELSIASFFFHFVKWNRRKLSSAPSYYAT